MPRVREGEELAPDCGPVPSPESGVIPRQSQRRAAGSGQRAAYGTRVGACKQCRSQIANSASLLPPIRPCRSRRLPAIAAFPKWWQELSWAAKRPAAASVCPGAVGRLVVRNLSQFTESGNEGWRRSLRARNGDLSEHVMVGTAFGNLQFSRTSCSQGPVLIQTDQLAAGKLNAGEPPLSLIPS
ncbi:hypothetical protein AXG93_4079s1290 [Marchantia polymorpha subsp. ruderalis]|uniref:Uncharacterized protein n=1 Tax=Marchantia polymorpha subsp. ruderalis TaxID=1480154 RepID=A0A176VT74_MARPO|nr:hypothetical protein AXG93_4079s1290 [Marchantia polymorpha subsp. ruderalis]